ncbi:WD repeat-containing protein 6 isoform X2 [Eucalyptus grandis]|uniref:WD repeat-containing protein 6 isoform X2 n=2 Tax=Eucalyptus grandis TaxID=71139 RepID=UPI00192EF3D4|nr:WD repeat-containing protein 6 isoform X2 [Eucalyptus grandis]
MADPVEHQHQQHQQHQLQQQRRRGWRIQGGQYLGEISALCFLHLPPPSPLPLLLAGSGSQVSLFDLASGAMVRTFYVFRGIRVHGIVLGGADFPGGSSSSSSTLDYVIAVYGERRVKLFRLSVRLGRGAGEGSGTVLSADLELVSAAPRLSHWVMDVRFLKNGTSEDELQRCLTVAIGCSDNSIRLWDVDKCSFVLAVSSPERCLLYSMRLWGDNLQDLQVASGTIYNEILIWKVVPNHDAPSSNELTEEGLTNSCAGNSLLHECLRYEAYHICRLVGHEGSIFRIAWSSDGSKLVSVSDDRSARIWEVHCKVQYSEDAGEVGLLFGHSARVWDCYISDNLIVTAGEDCSCRVWGLDGQQHDVIKEHIGRGIWRCLYDPWSSLLVTGGFDSAIKVHKLDASLAEASAKQSNIKDLSDGTELFTSHLPNSSGHSGHMDSKSEYVRCLSFSCEDVMYIATNHGYLYHAKLCNDGDLRWTELAQVSNEVQVICMELLPSNPYDPRIDADDWVAVGDGKGWTTVVRVVKNSDSPKVSTSFSWAAEMDRQLLGIHWCKSLGHRFIFTADPRGALKLWRFFEVSQSSSLYPENSPQISLIAEFKSDLGARIMCLDVAFESELLICGDLRGNLVLFPLLKDLLLDTFVVSAAKISPVNHFKGAHGISAVSSISVAHMSFNHIELRSTGADGCICYMEYDKGLQSLNFVGMKQVKELSMIESVSTENESTGYRTSGSYASGFASTDFIIWNLVTEAKVLQVSCGGWRRPHSYYLGDVPEMKNCFAYVKDDIIYIRRHWIKDSKDKILPQNLRLQFHGREVHSLCFVTGDFQLRKNKQSSWIVTGCEDGTVRLTRYTQCTDNWSSSKLLGEHVGGSAVRSICCVSNIHTTSSGTSVSDVKGIENLPKDVKGTLMEDECNPSLLISVGAKRVLTSWLLRRRKQDGKEDDVTDLQEAENSSLPSSAGSSTFSFQWLSTDMPVKYSVPSKKPGSIKKLIGVSDTNVRCKSLLPDSEALQSKVSAVDKNEDDWRYLAVTAFLVRHSGSRLIVCFIIVACSDATLAIRALVLPYRLWFDVALMVPLSSPVLSLQHVIIRRCQLPDENVQIGNVYVVISGATDGSIAFWDLTESVEAFMRRLSNIHLEKFMDFQKRPRTGRGSQGGRWWRSLSKIACKEQPINDPFTAKAIKELNRKLTGGVACGSSSSMLDASPELDSNAANSSFEIIEVNPFHVLNGVHQSGVNCLHVCETKQGQSSDGRFLYQLVSGGDDQALHLLKFEVLVQPPVQVPDVPNSDIRNSILVEEFLLDEQNQKTKCTIEFISQEKIASAHNSAVKGVWTDGTWVFSTGLDQRVRCWISKERGTPTELAHFIISVPEPEALDARSICWDQYQIAVAGRGMQMIEFHVPSSEIR